MLGRLFDGESFQATRTGCFTAAESVFWAWLAAGASIAVNSSANLAKPLIPMGKMYHIGTGALLRSRADCLGPPSPGLFLHFHAPPEADLTFDLARRRLGVRIVPGSIRVILSVDQQIHIPRLALRRVK